jgi:uncharacterized protein involved in exopolysaccharide biosynthesis
MEEIDILEVLRRRMWMIIVVCLVATVAAYVGSLFLAKRYTASAYLLVRPQPEIKLDTRTTNKEFLDFPMGQSAVETPSKTYIEIIKSPAFVGELVQKLSLDTVDETKSGTLSKYLPSSWKPAIDGLKQTIKSSISFLVYGTVIPEDRFADAVRSVQRNMVLESRPDTYIFTIAYTATEPEKASNIANAIAKLFIEYMEEVRGSEGKYVRARLRAQLQAGREQLEAARQRLESFKKEHSTFRYEAEYTSDIKVIADLETEVAKLDESLAGLATVANDRSLSKISLLAKRDSLLDTIKQRKAELVPLPAMERELKQLDLVERVALTAYEIVDKVYQEAQIKDSYAAREVQLVSQAVPPHLPGGPTRLLIGLVALLGGIVVGVSLAFLLEYQNRRIRGIRDVEDHVGVKVIATIPRVARRR